MGERVSTLPSEQRYLRQRAGLSLIQLARRTEISIGHLSEVERGLARPSKQAKQRIDAAITRAYVKTFRREIKQGVLDGRS